MSLYYCFTRFKNFGNYDCAKLTHLNELNRNKIIFCVKPEFRFGKWTMWFVEIHPRYFEFEITELQSKSSYIVEVVWLSEELHCVKNASHSLLSLAKDWMVSTVQRLTLRSVYPIFSLQYNNLTNGART